MGLTQNQHWKEQIKNLFKIFFLEKEVNRKGLKLDNMSLDEMDNLWNESKKYIHEFLNPNVDKILKFDNINI